jgi:large subunit ribosomal protein L7/L12
VGVPPITSPQVPLDPPPEVGAPDPIAVPTPNPAPNPEWKPNPKLPSVAPDDRPRDRGGAKLGSWLAGSSHATETLIDTFKEMTLIELSEFVKQFEDTFGVTAAAPVAAVFAARAAGAAVEEVEEPTEFDVILQSVGEKKIGVIKEVRALTDLGLKEAKDLVEAAPKPVLEKVTKEAAAKAREQLEASGATVLVRDHGA